MLRLLPGMQALDGFGHGFEGCGIGTSPNQQFIPTSRLNQDEYGCSVADHRFLPTAITSGHHQS